MRAIDGDALLVELMDRNLDHLQRDDWKEVIQIVADAPTIAPKQKRGKWIKEYWNGEHTRKCSACNITQTVTTYRGKVSFNYCPYCGARMER